MTEASQGDDVVDAGHGADAREDFDYDGNDVDTQIVSAAWSCIHLCSGRDYLCLDLDMHHES